MEMRFPYKELKMNQVRIWKQFSNFNVLYVLDFCKCSDISLYSFSVTEIVTNRIEILKPYNLVL